jgi:hypothetical protein
MATVLKNIVRFAGLVEGNPVALPHGINLDGRALTPELVIPNAGPFTIAVDATNVTVTRTADSPGDSVDVLVEWFYTPERVFDPQNNPPAGFPIIIPGAGVGGSGSGVGGGDIDSELWALPASPSAFDDEFNADALDAAWIRNYTVSASQIDATASFAAGDTREELNGQITGIKRSHLRLQPPGDGATKQLRKFALGDGITLPDGFYYIRAFCTSRNRTPVQGDNEIGFTLQKSVSAMGGNGVTVWLFEQDAGLTRPEAQIINDGVVGGPDSFAGDLEIVGQPYAYVGILKNGTQYDTFFAGGNGNWIWLQRYTYTGSEVIDSIVLKVNAASTDAPGNSIMGWDFVRYIPENDLA